MVPNAKDLIKVSGSDTVWEVRYIDNDYLFLVGTDERLGDDDVLVQIRTIGMRTFVRDSTWELVSRPS